jgi:serpin B
MRKAILVLILSAAMIITASLHMARASSEPGQSASKSAASHNAFAFRMLEELVKEYPGKNIVISPLSIELALSMTYNGARGETEKAMANAMGVPGIKSSELNSLNMELLKRLEDKDRDVELTVANSIWLKPGLKVNREFISQVSKGYSASIKNVLNVAEINGWVVKNTKGRIKKIIDDVAGETVMMLINAVYFKGAWTTPFNKNKTSDQLFHLNDTDTVTVPMMRREKVSGFAKFDECQSVYLTYGNAKAYRMYIFCPNQVTGLPDFVAHLNNGSWDNYMKEFQKTAPDRKSKAQQVECRLTMPRFTGEFDADLIPSLSRLGMEIAFQSGKADFTGIADGLFIERVLHKCSVDVNEEGTEAAAATAVMVGRGMGNSVVADHPFFFAVTHGNSSTILFMGAVYNPHNKVKR